ncbi:MAG: hypothetical protein KDH96_08545 [Candidatus Riesia sp.]|nr:hypothetical protein [Candidatus Riesia sp.]
MEISHIKFLFNLDNYNHHFSDLFFFMWVMYLFEVGKIWKSDYIDKGTSKYDMYGILSKGYDVLTLEEGEFKCILNFIDLEEAVLVQRLRDLYLNGRLKDVNLNLLYDVPISLDAIASGNQNLSLVLGVKTGFDEFINLNSPSCTDTYSALINKFLVENPDIDPSIFNRKFLKKTIMTLNYSASYQTVFIYFKKMLDKKGPLFDSSIEDGFKLFYKWLKKNIDILYHLSLKDFKKDAFNRLLFTYRPDNNL